MDLEFQELQLVYVLAEQFCGLEVLEVAVEGSWWRAADQLAGRHVFNFQLGAEKQEGL